MKNKVQKEGQKEKLLLCFNKRKDYNRSRCREMFVVDSGRWWDFLSVIPNLATKQEAH